MVDALALIVAALGGGVVATILNEWLRGRREYDEARLLVLSELATMPSGRAERPKRPLHRRVGRSRTSDGGVADVPGQAGSPPVEKYGRLGALTGVYTSVDLLRANPAAADIAGLQRSVDAAHAALSGLGLRPFWRPTKTP